MMVGFSYNHPNLTFRLFKFSTKSIIHSRDVRWLNKYYSEYFNCDKITKSSLLSDFPVNELVIPSHNNNEKPLFIPMDTLINQEFEDNIDNDDISLNSNNNSNSNIIPNEIKKLHYENKELRSGKTRSDTIRNNLSNNLSSVENIILNVENNKDELNDISDIKDFKKEYKKYLNKKLVENRLFLLEKEKRERNRIKFIKLRNSMKVNNEPITFLDSWNYNDNSSKYKWRESIIKEFIDLYKRNVFTIIEKPNIFNSDRKPIGLKWVFTIKDDGRYRSRLVAQGFTQVEGIDYKGSYAPILSEKSFRILLIMKLKNPKWDCIKLDIETAFLNTKLEENLYVELPPGYEIYNKVSNLDINQLDINDLSLIESLTNTNISKFNKYKTSKVCKLNAALYGLVQASREFYIKTNKILIDLDFKNCKSDPCLYKRDSLYIGLYVDDIFIVGPKTLINNFVEEISKILSIRKYDEVLDFWFTINMES